MILPIAKLPAKILRTPTEDVAFPLSKNVKRLCRDMLDTVKKADGIGLAAPQVSKNLNMALIFLESGGNKGRTFEDPGIFFIFNPKITKVSKETVTIEEGCLSAPGVFGKVTRPKKITVEFYDIEGKFQSITDDGWVARVCQHEIDHLHETLILDKLEEVTKGEELLEKYL